MTEDLRGLIYSATHAVLPLATDETSTRDRARMQVEIADHVLAAQQGEAVDANAAWTELCERDDRTSPEDYPDMCLITREELADFMGRAAPAQPDTGDAAALRKAGRNAIWKVVHEVWQLLDDGETDSAGVTTVDQERLQAVAEAMDALEALVPDSEGPFWGGFPVNYFWNLAALPRESV